MRVIYTNHFIPRYAGAINLWVVILMRPQFKDGSSLLRHEEVHTKQMNKYPVLYFFLYFLSRKWRLKFEVEAYQVQLGYARPEQYSQWIDAFAASLSGPLYRLKIDYVTAYTLIRGW